MAVLFLILLIIFIGIPLLVSFIIHRIIKKYYPKKAFAIALMTFIIPYVFIAIALYIGNNPCVNFYEDEFRRITQLHLPESAEFIYKKATFPDFQGEYTSSASIHLNRKDFIKLLSETRKSPKLIKTVEAGSDSYDWIKEKSGNQKYIHIASSTIESNYHFIGFCEDEKTVIIHLVKW